MLPAGGAARHHRRERSALAAASGGMWGCCKDNIRPVTGVGHAAHIARRSEPRILQLLRVSADGPVACPCPPGVYALSNGGGSQGAPWGRAALRRSVRDRRSAACGPGGVAPCRGGAVGRGARRSRCAARGVPDLQRRRPRPSRVGGAGRARLRWRRAVEQGSSYARSPTRRSAFKGGSPAAAPRRARCSYSPRSRCTQQRRQTDDRGPTGSLTAVGGSDSAAMSAREDPATSGLHPRDGQLARNGATGTVPAVEWSRSRHSAMGRFSGWKLDLLITDFARLHPFRRRVAVDRATMGGHPRLSPYSGPAKA